MFENLIESKPKKARTWGQAIMSVVVHGVVIVLAVQATAGAAEVIEKIMADTTFTFLKPPDPPPPPPPQEVPPDAIVTANPPPQGFQTIMPPDKIPTTIPPVNLNEKFNPDDFSGRGVAGGIAAGVIGGTGPVLQEETYLQEQVDDPVRPISQPTPRYPPVLQQAGITGRVEMQFVVDTTGHAEPGSFKILRSSNKAFEEPAREAIMKSVFRPARIRGQAVRQLVQQAMAFSITN